MGYISEIVTGQREFYWLNKTDHNRIYNEAFHEALYKLDPEDRENIFRILKEIAAPNGPIKQYGSRAVLETLGVLGIFLASLPEDQFRKLLEDRRNRRRKVLL